MSIRDLSKLNNEELKTFLDSFDTVLTDCDGVLWMSTPIPGSVDVINKLEKLGKKVFFVSNNATLTLEQYVEKFSSLGYHVKKEDIIIPPVVIASYLKEINFKKKALVLGCKTFKHILETDGIQCIDAGMEVVEESILPFINHLKNLDPELGAVIMDYDPNLNYLKLMQAVTVLKRDGCIFIVGATDHHVPLTKDIILIGPGYFVSIIEATTGRKPVIAGKPSKLVKKIISQRHNINPARTLMIGDSLTQDIRLGTECGFQKLLVLSGSSKLQEAFQDPSNLPDFYLRTLGDFLPLLSEYGEGQMEDGGSKL